MTTLVLHAPQWTVEAENKWSFEESFRTGIGDGYAIPRASAARCLVGCRVVLLSKDEGKRAEGSLVKLVPAGKTRTGMQRYDVHIANLRRVAYVPEHLTRTGVAVLDETHR